MVSAHGVEPSGGVYYWQRGTRQEEIQVQPLVCADAVCPPPVLSAVVLNTPYALCR